MFTELNDSNFVMFAMKHYDNPACKGTSEFFDDLKRFRYLKRLFKKNSNSEAKERLILNHIVVIFNLFGKEAALKMLFFKIEKKFWSQLKTFLYYLNYMPIGPIELNSEIIEGYEIPLDQNILDRLGRL